MANGMQGWGALGQMLGGNVGTPGTYEDTLRKGYDTEYALQRARDMRGQSIRSLGAAEEYERMRANRGTFAGQMGLDDALFTAMLTNPEDILGGALQGQEFQNRQGIVAAPDWETANRRAMAVDGKPLQLATVQGQNLIANQYAPGGGGITTTEQGRAGILKDTRQVFDAGQNGVYTLDLNSGTASPVSILGGGTYQPPTPTLGDGPTTFAGGADPFASLHASLPGLRVTSQFRTPEQNAAAGGVPNSFHQTGEAIDVGTPSPEQQAGIRQWAAANGYEIITNYQDGHWHLEPAGRSPGIPGFAGGGRQLVNAGGGAKGQNAPSGYRYTPTGDLEAIPGGPHDPNVMAARPLSPAQRAKQEQAQRKESGMVNSMEASLGQTIGLIDDLLADEGALFGVTGMGAGLSKIPGTRSADLAAKLQTLRARSAFGSLQEMRANSPTGGALGQVSERELDLLMNAETQLSQAQSPKAFADALRNYKRTLEGSRRRLREGFNEHYSDLGGTLGDPVAPAPPAGPAPGHVEGGYRFRGGDPSNQSNWERV